MKTCVHGVSVHARRAKTSLQVDSALVKSMKSRRGGLPEQFSDASDVAKTPRSLLADTEPLRESPSESDRSSSE